MACIALESCLKIRSIPLLALDIACKRVKTFDLSIYEAHVSHNIHDYLIALFQRIIRKIE